MNKIVNNCPVCDGDLYLKTVECLKCGSSLSGKFYLPKEEIVEKVVEENVSSIVLDDELDRFLRVFISAEGSIKQTEKILNCSYPKVKNYLKKLKLALGLEDLSAKSASEEVLSLLEDGKIGVEEALKRLK